MVSLYEEKHADSYNKYDIYLNKCWNISTGFCLRCCGTNTDEKVVNLIFASLFFRCYVICADVSLFSFFSPEFALVVHFCPQTFFSLWKINVVIYFLQEPYVNSLIQLLLY